MSDNVAELVKAGHPVNQAAAIAYNEAGKYRKKPAEEELNTARSAMNRVSHNGSPMEKARVSAAVEKKYQKLKKS